MASGSRASLDPAGEAYSIGLRLVCESGGELRRLRAVRGAHERTRRRIRRALATVALGASLLGIPLAATAAQPSFFAGFGEDGRSPTFADIDGDGDLDAFVGDPGGRAVFFENTGSASAAVFGAPVTSPFGLADVGSAASPVFADIDADGDLDAFIGNYAGTIVHFENTGTAAAPAFAAAQSNPFGLVSVAGPAVPALVDVNFDGDLDALVGDGAGQIVYFRNNGSVLAPAFGLPETNPFGLTSVTPPARPAFVDIDGDGDLDGFIGERFGNWIHFENTKSSGIPAFAAPTTNPFGLEDVGYFSAPAFADVDGDGDLDAFVGRHDEVVLLFGNTGSATTPAFDSPSPAEEPFGLPTFEYDSVLAFADIDGDGDLDAFAGEYEGRIFFFQNAGTAERPQFGGGNPFGIGAGTYRPRVATADIDGDGDLDVFVGGSFYGEVYFYENTGSATDPVLAPPRTNALGILVDASYVVPGFTDLDGDGDLDGLFGAGSGQVLWLENTGSSASPAFAAPLPGAFGLADVGSLSVAAFGDLDDDGDLDAVVGSGSGSTAFFANTGTATAPAFASPQFAAFGLVGVDARAVPTLGDLDGDGDLDALVGDAEASSYFFENTGSAAAPAFAPAVTNPFGLAAFGEDAGPHLADIDGDGDLDALIGFAEYGLIVFFENTGSSVSPAFSLGGSRPYLVPQAYYYSGPTFGDIDGDGDFDALVGQADGNFTFFENTGTASAAGFAAGETNPFGLVNIGGYDTRVDLADIDGDGDLDAFVGSNAGETVFFQNDGSATSPAFGSPQTNPFGITSVVYDAAPGLADVDQDGDLDLFVGDHEGDVNYFENTGTAMAPAFVSPPDPNPFGLREIVYKHSNPTFVDIDGDGDLDFFSGEYFGRTIFSRNGISNSPGSGVPHVMEYEVKESNRSAPGGALPVGCHVGFTDPVFDFGDGRSDTESYEVSLVRSLGLPADTSGEGEVDSAATHLLGYRVRGSVKGALPVLGGKFRSARPHARRTGVLVTIPDPGFHDGSGANTVRLETKKVTRVLMPANASLAGVPDEPGPEDSTDRYKCYQVKASSIGGVGTLQDSRGKVRRGLQAVALDSFADGQDHPTLGDARLFDLRGVTELCNPVAQASIDTVEQDATGSTRTTSCAAPPVPIHHPATSLLCWRAGLALSELPQPWDGSTPGAFIVPRQERHEKRTLGTGNPVYVGHALGAPDRVDTSKEKQLCFPVAVTDRGTVKR